MRGDEMISEFKETVNNSNVNKIKKYVMCEEVKAPPYFIMPGLRSDINRYVFDINQVFEHPRKNYYQD